MPRETPEHPSRGPHTMRLILVLLSCFVASCLLVSGVLEESIVRVGAGLGFLVVALIVQGVGGSPDRPARHPLHRDRLRDQHGRRGHPW